MQATKEKRWYITWEETCNNFAEGLVHERIEGSSMLYAIAKIEDVPIDENGDLIREGEDADRLKDVLLLVYAPEMLRGIKRAIERLEAITGLNKPDSECGTWIKDDETKKVWRRIAEVQDQLERIASDAQDLDNI